jgi:hypothetical protein
MGASVIYITDRRLCAAYIYSHHTPPSNGKS